MRDPVIIRGGGDIATGCVQKLYRAGMRVVVLESPHPTAIRRAVAVSEAVYRGSVTVEDMTARHCRADEVASVWAAGEIPVVVDPQADLVGVLKPPVVVDAILAKKNLGTHKAMAAVTIALGPGFTAPDDVDAVVETMRGHDLGRLIFDGAAVSNTGTPAIVAGVGAERVVHAPTAGTLRTACQIGECVGKGQTLAWIGDTAVPAPIAGVLRGILPDGFEAWPGLKLADIDPRADERGNCFTISDKARCIGGAVLEGIIVLNRRLCV